MRKVAFEALRQRFGFACGYCGISETDVGAKLTVDHFRPQVAGGDDSTDNLIYCCHACNEYKGDFYAPNADARLLHPLHDDVTLHLSQQADGTLQALTEAGRFHIAHLQLNRSFLVRYRQREQAMRQTQTDISEILNLLRAERERTDSLNERVLRLERGGE